MTVIGDEGRRQAYLAALGIPLWASRQALPHVLPGAGLDFTPYVGEASVELYSEEAVIEAPAPAPSPTPVAPAASAPVARPAPVEAPRPRVEPPATAPIGKKPVEFPRFSFWFKALPQGWRLLIALGEVPDLSAQEHLLLSQIEAVLGGAGHQAPTLFRWPLNNNPAIPRDAQAATEAVGAFLQRAHRPDNRYLVLGDELLPFVRPALGGEKLAAGASLSRLLAEPLRKRELWQSLITHL